MSHAQCARAAAPKIETQHPADRGLKTLLPDVFLEWHHSTFHQNPTVHLSSPAQKSDAGNSHDYAHLDEYFLALQVPIHTARNKGIHSDKRSSNWMQTIAALLQLDRVCPRFLELIAPFVSPMTPQGYEFFPSPIFSADNAQQLPKM
ncbi:Uncharacterised protein [Chlamydia trachomatis]|nr:Uncharacterised protein [Chlamydia trachomatis]